MANLKFFVKAYGGTEYNTNFNNVYFYLPIDRKNYTKEELLSAAETAKSGRTAINQATAISLAKEAVNTGIFASIVDNNTDANNTLDSVNFGGMTVTYSRNLDSDRFPLLLNNAKKIKGIDIIVPANLHINMPNLESFEGNIIANGTAGVKFNIGNSKLRYAKGNLILSDVTHFEFICDTLKPESQGFNVLDLRNVVTTNCTYVKLLNNFDDECVIIFGQFDTGNVTEFYFQNAATSGRYAVMTTETPPIIRNCNIVDGQELDEHSDRYDWITLGKFERIYVPQEYMQTYINNTYIDGGTIGKTGWSYYGPSGLEYGGKNIIESYNPELEYVAREEWIYTATNWRKQ